MRIGVLGTGTVGKTLATKLAQLGHEVMLGSRTADNPSALEWVEATGGRASCGTFADAAAFGELVLNCTAGAVSLEALHAASAENLAGKTLVDVSNPLDFSQGMPPTLTVCNTDSVGEQIQRAFPETNVVKTLNTVNANVMVEPGLVPGTSIFVCGEQAEAKVQVSALLQEIGWPTEAIVDLGDISRARGPEMYLMLWLGLMGALGTAQFNIALVR